MESINPHISRQYKFGLKITDCFLCRSWQKSKLQAHQAAWLWKSEILQMFVYKTISSSCTIFGRPFVKQFARCPVCDAGVLWPHGCMDQDTTWYGGRPRPWPHCVRWGSTALKGVQPPIFGPCLLWPNGWMDEDDT